MSPSKMKLPCHERRSNSFWQKKTVNYCQGQNMRDLMTILDYIDIIDYVVCSLSALLLGALVRLPESTLARQEL